MVAQGDFSPGYQFGFNVVEIDRGGPPVVRREMLPTRLMHAYGLHDATGLSSRDVVTFLERQAEAVPPRSAYCQVEIDGLEPLTKRDLSTQTLSRIFEGHSAMRLLTRVRELTQDELSKNQVETSPMARFQRLAKNQEGDPEFVQAVTSLGVSMLTQAQEQLSAEDVEGGD